MAIRQEELTGGGAIVYRFPLERTRRPRRASVARRRAALGLVTVAISAVLLLATGPQGVSQAGPQAGRRAVVVAPGTTLWGIAEDHAPEGMDLRAYIDAVEELNGLNGPIQPGMRLKLPR